MSHKETLKNKTVYELSHYESGDGMLTSVWGPSLWHVLHTMSFNYPNEPTREDKQNYKNFILNLQNVLPCRYCRINLKSNFKQLPLTMECMKNRYTFSMYVYNLHEIINKMLNKKSGLTYDDVRERYEHFRARCGKKNKKKTRFIKSMKLNKTKKKHKGCTEPIHKVKSKGVVHIVPQKTKCESLVIHDKCTEIKN
tara:strand:- start:5064 stop:5651 length:588 start_codon:yes stop_codon:yes gene_type:complete